VTTDVVVLVKSEAEPLLLVVFCVLELDKEIEVVLRDEIDAVELDVDFGGFIELVSVEQSTKLHRSLQSRKHISVQLVVPAGQPQAHRSMFELLKDQAPSRVPTMSAYASARLLHPHSDQVGSFSLHCLCMHWRKLSLH
jgi:hypothetical protein